MQNSPSILVAKWMQTRLVYLTVTAVGIGAFGLTACGPPRAASVDKALARQHSEQVRLATLSEPTEGPSVASTTPCSEEESAALLPGSRTYRDVPALAESLGTGSYVLRSVAVSYTITSIGGAILGSTTNTAEADEAGRVRWKQACHYNGGDGAPAFSQSAVSVPLGFNVSGSRPALHSQAFPLFSDLSVTSHGRTTARPLRLDARLEIPFTGAIPRFQQDPQVETTAQGQVRFVIKDLREDEGKTVESVWILRFNRKS